MHLTLADILRTMEVEVMDDCPIRINDTLDTMLQSADWSLRTTVITVTNVNPGMAIFGRDMIFNFQLRVNWDQIARKRNRPVDTISIEMEFSFKNDLKRKNILTYISKIHIFICTVPK